MSLRHVPESRPRVENAVKEVLPRRMSPEAQRVAFRDNPTPRAEDLGFIAENSRIHRKFVRDIMGLNDGRKADLVVFTGSTYDVAADPLSVAGYLEGFQPDEFPNIGSWASMRYLDRHDAAPNAIVYKNISRSALREGRNNISLARSFLAHKEEWTSEVQSLLEKPDEAIARVADMLKEGRTIIPRDKYVVGKVLQELSKTQSIFSKIPGETHREVDALLGLIHDAENLAELYAEELPDLDEAMKNLYDNANFGRYPEADGQDDAFEIPHDESRVTLMKALYPEYLASLFDEEGNPKEIVFYDNVSISGKKTTEYLHFFEQLGIADHVRIYLMYTKPGAQFDFPPSATKIQVGKEINDSFVKYMSDSREDAQFQGLAHDRKTKYLVPEDEYVAGETPAEKEQRVADLRRRQVLALTEQLLLPEEMDALTSRMKEWAAQSERGNDAYANMLIQFLESGELFPRLITPSYQDYEEEEYATFEQVMRWEVGADKKRYFRVARKALDRIQEQFADSGKKEMRLLSLDNEVAFVVKTLLRHPHFEALQGKVEIVDAYELSAKVKERKTDQITDKFTMAIGANYPSYQTEYLNAIKNGGFPIESVVILGDGRKVHTDESRLKALKEMQSSFQMEATNYGVVLQAAEAFSPSEIAATIQERVQREPRLVQISEYYMDEARTILRTGADALNEHIAAAQKKLDELGMGDAFFQTKEYLEYQKDVQDLIEWATKLYKEAVEKNERVAQAAADSSLEDWQKYITDFQDVPELAKKISTIVDLLRILGLGEKIGAYRGGKPPENIMQVVNDFVYIRYGSERLAERGKKKLTDKYAEEYLSEEQFPLQQMSSEGVGYMFMPRLYKSDIDEPTKLATRSTEVAKSLEAIRYLSEVSAFEDEEK